VFYTDGVSEAEREGGEMFGEERLYALLDGAPRDLSAERLVEHVLAGVRGWLAGVEPGDDITVMALRVLEPGAVRS
jgi:sigma-B regulation protein RsbU (phosphoserine phosphatase)